MFKSPAVEFHMSKKSILFIHKNFPAQFGTLGKWLSTQGWDVTFATKRKVVGHQGFRVVQFANKRDITKGVHRYLAGTEGAIIEGQGFARTGIVLANEGYRPDIVVAHSGWGVGTFAKDVWPDAKFVSYAEWWYQWPAVDRSPHDTPDKEPVDARARTRVRNTPMLLDLMASDAILCPTRFQADQFPKMWRDRMTVMHDGIDTDLNSPGPLSGDLGSELGIPPEGKTLTFVARGMEPQRGFPEAMQAASILMQRNSNLHFVVVGEDRVAYGNRAKVDSWKAKMLAELDFDESRLHFTGLVPRNKLVDVFRLSDAHLYLSTPFVLSWSVLDAMSCGCHVVAAKSAATEEFIQSGMNGDMVSVSETGEIVQAVENAMSDEIRSKTIRSNARSTIVDNVSISGIFPQKEAFFGALIG